MSREAKASAALAEPSPERTVVVAIPARYESVRLPGKPLIAVAGKSLIERVYRRVAALEGIAGLVVLTDDERIHDAVESFGGDCEMTPADCPSGTDRVAWAARRWQADAVLNVQGDEPLIDTHDLERVTEHLLRHPEDPVVTLATACPADLVEDPNAVKVVTDLAGYALYFSRAPIPHQRRSDAAGHRLHVGVYGYQRQALLELADLEPSPLERSEALEQLRALENGYPIRVLAAERPSIGVDTPADLERVERLIRDRERDESQAQ